MDIGVNLCIQSECRKMGTRKNSVSGYFSSCLRHCCATLPTLNCINFYCLSFHFIYLLYHLSSCFLLPKKLLFMIHNLLNSSPTSRKKKQWLWLCSLCAFIDRIQKSLTSTFYHYVLKSDSHLPKKFVLLASMKTL